MALEYKNHRSFPLRLPRFMHEQADLLARREGISLHAFIERAIGEKLSHVARSTAVADQRVRHTPMSQPAPHQF